ncbi:MAG: metallophosphoesterase [Candidatus Lokiarchaeota archaeon]|nr:metallophosphoesterase [Candidatus Lokiarchaeota archaeon]
MQDRETQKLMEMTVEHVIPNLVILTGDILSGSNCNDPRESLRHVVSVFEERKIYWAAVFGNHDHEGSVSREGLMDEMVSYSTSLTQPGPIDISGVGNYFLPIKSSYDKNPSAVIYLMDSGSEASTDIGGYGWIQRDQIEWYIHESTSLTESPGKPLPALAFFHIPLPEYNEVWDFHDCYGLKYEPVCCPRINAGLFAAMHEMGDIMGVFVGHDHINDYEGDLHGIRLCYCRGTGFHTYGRDGFSRGARIIQLVEGERDFRTWQYLADGSEIHSSPKHSPMGRVLTDG